MSTLAAHFRPESWNFPLLLHVLGAMVLVGAAAVGSTASLAAGRSDESAFLRKLAFRSFLIVALPAYIVMRVGAEWLYSKLSPAEDPTWIGIGYITADLGALILIVTLILSGLAVRRGGRLSQIAGIISLVAVIGWLVTVWAMSGKV